MNYFKDPLGEERLRSLLDKADLRPIEAIRKKEAEFKELGLSEDTPDDELIRAMVEHPALLQRPIVEVGDRAVLARPVKKALELLNRNSE